MEADPDARIYLGLQPGVGPAELGRALVEGTVEPLLGVIPARPGELIPVPPGTVHAIGAGTLLAEVQQPSDTTYRVYDWGRVGLDGKPRQLHVEEALQSIHWEEQARVGPAAGDAVDMQLFRFERIALEPGGEPLDLDGEGPAVVVGLAGSGELRPPGDAPVTCTRGEVVLLPHSCRRTTLAARTGAQVLTVTFPGGA
jgi:mannose-6-phosphate isomerase